MDRKSAVSYDSGGRKSQKHSLFYNKTEFKTREIGGIIEGDAAEYNSA